MAQTAGKGKVRGDFLKKRSRYPAFPRGTKFLLSFFCEKLGLGSLVEKISTLIYAPGVVFKGFLRGALIKPLFPKKTRTGRGKKNPAGIVEFWGGPILPPPYAQKEINTGKPIELTMKPRAFLLIALLALALALGGCTLRQPGGDDTNAVSPPDDGNGGGGDGGSGDGGSTERRPGVTAEIAN